MHAERSSIILRSKKLRDKVPLRDRDMNGAFRISQMEVQLSHIYGTVWYNKSDGSLRAVRHIRERKNISLACREGVAFVQTRPIQYGYGMNYSVLRTNGY
jgi:hypothetical protein